MSPLQIALGTSCAALIACSSGPRSSPASDAAPETRSSVDTLQASLASAAPKDRVDFGNQHVKSATQITWHNAANGHPDSDPAYACIQNHQIAINPTPSFKAEKLGVCPGGVLEYFKYTWKE
jgi:hypothetical protein